MNFYLIGIDYRRADINLREAVYHSQKEIARFWNVSIQEAAILSTCNRFEIYGADSLSSIGRLESFYSRFPQFAAGYYIAGRADVFRHALRLACGLESQLKGEAQILEQLGLWLRQKEIPAVLLNFWNTILQEAKDIRNYAGLNQRGYNIAAAIFADLKRYRPCAEQLEVVIAGTGKIAELLAVFRPDYVHLNFISHKNKLRAQKLAEYSKGLTLSFRDMPGVLSETDVLISATSSPHFVFKKAHFEQLISKRKAPLYLYDLAIPRDIEPSVAGLEGIVLKNLDDLTPTLKNFSVKIKDKLSLAEYLSGEAVKEYEQGAQDLKDRDASQQISLKAS